MCLDNLSCHGVVKTREENLEVIETTNQIFNSHPEGNECIEYEKGIDTLRMERYEIWAVLEIYWRDFEYSFRVVRVEEAKLKGKGKGKKKLSM